VESFTVGTKLRGREARRSRSVFAFLSPRLPQVVGSDTVLLLWPVLFEK